MTKKLFSIACYSVTLALPLWLIGFGVFVLYVFSFRVEKMDITPAPDAIVAWTGGEYRIQTALNLLAQNKAKYLLISGVNKTVRPEAVLGQTSPEIRKKITLGYYATTTKENALETADWVAEKALKSIILVTSFYHMPRSLLEFKHEMPSIQVIPHLIWPKDFTDSVSWLHTRAAFHLFMEYHKFLFVKLQYLLEGFVQ